MVENLRKQALANIRVEYFRMRISRQSRGPRDIELGPNDINLQTEELHCNYLVLIGSLE